MAEPEIIDAEVVPSRAPEGMLRLAHIIYGLHSIALLTGIVGSATIVGSFVAGLPSILAVILNYAKRSEVRGTWLDSHFSWQIRTFWFALLWIVLATGLVLTILGIPLALAVVAAAGLWVIYRIVRGWLALNSGQPMPM
jgi:uncharacterized membrane protein